MTHPVFGSQADLRTGSVPNMAAFDLDLAGLAHQLSAAGVRYTPFYERTATSSMDMGRILRERGHEVGAGDVLIVGLQTQSQTTKAGKPWLNGPKDIALTLAIPDEGTFLWCKLVELAAGIAVAQALRGIVAAVPARIDGAPLAHPSDIVVKYPNDVRVQTPNAWKKICGTLPVGAFEDVPDAPLSRMRRAGFDLSPIARGLMLLGIGVNIGREIEDLPPGELPIPAASLEGLIGQTPPKISIITALLAAYQGQHRMISERDPRFFAQLETLGYPSDERIYVKCLDGREFCGVMRACSFESMRIETDSSSEQFGWTEIQRFFPARYAQL